MKFTYDERLGIVGALRMNRRTEARYAWENRNNLKYREDYFSARRLHIKVKSAFIEGEF